jgi:hypothetical protein
MMKRLLAIQGNVAAKAEAHQEKMEAARHSMRVDLDQTNQK